MIEACKGYGCIPAKFMFVGISAGKLGALKTEVPFTKDMSGRLLQRVLYHLGLSKTADEKTLRPELVNCYLTNMVKGRILDKKGNNRLPNETEVLYWLPKLQHELIDVKPTVIIALGKLVGHDLQKAFQYGLLLKTPGLTLMEFKHPRAYGSRGAINIDSVAWSEMLSDYQRHLKQFPIN